MGRASPGRGDAAAERGPGEVPALCCEDRALGLSGADGVASGDADVRGSLDLSAKI